LKIIEKDGINTFIGKPIGIIDLLLFKKDCKSISDNLQ